MLLLILLIREKTLILESKQEEDRMKFITLMPIYFASFKTNLNYL